MLEYMPFTRGMFNDVLKDLGIVDYYLSIVDAEVTVQKAELKLNECISASQHNGEHIRDEIYDVIVSNKEKAGEDTVSKLKDIITRYREAKVKAQPFLLLHQVASEAHSLFTTFDEEAFLKAANETGLMVGAKEAKTAEASARAALSKAKKALSDARATYKVGIFTKEALVFTLPPEEQEQFSVDRAKSFYSVWLTRAKKHGEPVTIECTSIKSLPEKGGLRRTWTDAYLKLFPKITRQPVYAARPYKD